MPTRRFLLFAFTKDEPRGGWSDLVGSFETTEAAMARLYALPDMIYAHIVDTATSNVMSMQRIGKTWGVAEIPNS